MKELTPFEILGGLIPEDLTNVDKIPGYVRLLVQSYAEIMDSDIVDSAYFVKNTFVKQLGWEITNEQWGDIIKSVII